MTSAYSQAADIELDGDIEQQPPVAAKPRPSLPVIGAALMTLFFVVQILELFPALGKLQLAKLTVLAVIIMFLASRERIASRIRLRSAPLFKYILGILALGAITIPLAAWPAQSFQFVTDYYVKNVIFTYLLIQIARSNRDSRIIAGALVSGCALLVLAMLAGFGESFIEEQEVRLAVGKAYDPNDLALLFVVSIPFAFFMLKSSRPLVRVLLISAIGLMLIGMGKGGSRGGFLGLIVVGTLILMRGSKQARKYTLLTLAVGVMLFAFAAPPEYWSRISTIYDYQDDYNLHEKTGRVMIWQTGLKMWAAHPIAGVGIGCFNAAYDRYSKSEINISPHNIFVQITAELGTIGLALFTAILIISIRKMRLIRRRAREGLAPEEMWWLASAIEVSFIGFVVSGFFLSQAYSSIFCFLTGMAGALIVRYKASTEPEADDLEEIEYA